MLRLYLRFYFALLASLAVVRAGGRDALASRRRIHANKSGVTVGRLLQNALPPAPAPGFEQQAALQRLAAGLDGGCHAVRSRRIVVAAVGRPLPAAGHAAHAAGMISLGSGARFLRPSCRRPVVGGQRADRLTIHARSIFHLLCLCCAGDRRWRLSHCAAHQPAAGAPATRRRVARRRRSDGPRGRRRPTTKSRGSRQASTAPPARSSSWSSAIKSLLANASHELRTPLARIRLAVGADESSPPIRSQGGPGAGHRRARRAGRRDPAREPPRRCYRAMCSRRGRSAGARGGRMRPLRRCRISTAQVVSVRGDARLLRRLCEICWRMPGATARRPLRCE